MQTEREILFDRKGAAGIVTLNRPHALNALTLAMVRALASKLRETGIYFRRHQNGRFFAGRVVVLAL